MNIIDRLKAIFNNDALAKQTFLKTIDRGSKTIFAMKQEMDKSPLKDHFGDEFDQALAMGAELRILLEPKKKMDAMCIVAINMYRKRIDDVITHFQLHKANPDANINKDDAISKISEIVKKNPKNPKEAMEEIMKVPGVVGAKVADVLTGETTQAGVLPDEPKESGVRKPKRAD